MIRRLALALVLAALANLPGLDVLLGPVSWPVLALLLLALLAGSAYAGVLPIPRKTAPTRRIWLLESGCELLRLFLLSAAASVAVQGLLLWRLYQGAVAGGTWVTGLICVLWAIFWEAVLFWNGMVRVYLTSVQLGIKHRVLAAICGWIPGVNIWYLTRIIRLAGDEVEVETEKWELDAARAESEICRTKYPILLVHGVFFRDSRYLNYWGRIPRELQRNGAVVYYGQQQSAASVEDSGRELAERIRRIVAETGCEKVNIIAHSKGGLDSRAAIAHQDCAPYVATLTTINTPHQGCIFAEYLLEKLPEAVRQKLADTYNAALRRLGDDRPDFLAAVTDLTASACKARNETTPDAPEVSYRSVMSYCRKAQNGKFPLNVTYPLVKHFDGLNDGLVAVESARWGESFTLLEPKGRRGISHGDVVDLNRENIPGFDVREFYVSLVAELKNSGY